MSPAKKRPHQSSIVLMCIWHFFSINSLCEQNHDWFIISLFYAIWDNFSWFCLIKYTWILVHGFLQRRGNIIHLFPHHLFEFGVLVHILYYRFICTKLQITLVRVWTAYTKSWISFHPHNEIECFTNQNKVDLTLYHLQQMDHQMGTNIARKGHINQTSFLMIKVRIMQETLFALISKLHVSIWVPLFAHYNII